MPTRRASRCTPINPDGSRCQAPCVRGTPVCVFHSPGRAEQGAAARRRGGQMRTAQLRIATMPETTPDLPLRTVQDIIAAVETTFNAVRRGQLDAKIGN